MANERVVSGRLDSVEKRAHLVDVPARHGDGEHLAGQLLLPPDLPEAADQGICRGALENKEN